MTWELHQDRVVDDIITESLTLGGRFHPYYFSHKIKVQTNAVPNKILTSLFKASAAVPRPSGSIERSASTSGTEEEGKSLKVSKIQRLYGCCGLKSVAFGSLYFFQYSSDGEPHNLNIL